MKIFIENPRSWHRFFIWQSIARGDEVSVFDFDYTARKKIWLRDLIDQGKVKKIGHYINENNGMALDRVDRIFDAYYRSSWLQEKALRFYQTPDVGLAYRKSLVEKLANFFAVWIILQEERKRHPQDDIILIPQEYEYYQRMIKEQCPEYQEILSLTVPPWARWLSGFYLLADRIKLICQFLAAETALIFAAFVKTFLLSSPRHIQHFQYAIAINNPGFQFKPNTNRSFDFLLDHHVINRTNTVFVLLSQLEESQRQELKDRQYHFIDATYREVLFHPALRFTKATGRKILKDHLALLGLSMLALWREKDIQINASLVLFMEQFRWKLVGDNARFDHFVIFNDENIRHIGRNLTLRQTHCRTWTYAHSAGLGYYRAKTKEEEYAFRHWLWSFLLYDYYLGWNQKLIEFFKLHKQKISHYVDTGCLWSSFVERQSEGQSIMTLDGGRRIDRRKNKIIGVFDSSYFDGISSQYPLKNGIKFCQDMIRLLNDNPEFFVIYKEKKPESWYSDKSSFVYSSLHFEYSQSLQKLRDHPRAYLPGPGGDTAQIISWSDLVITYAFSSTTNEALAARKKGIFYDPTGELRGTCYDAIPDLVAVDYAELTCLVRKWLYEMDQEMFENYLRTFIRQEMDTFVDGKALNRIRELMVAVK